ncbi:MULTISPECIES: hypothetical protein [unclassified Pseudomonas]|uniref:hypothetical protein n=1 Tax=unclassified Pseudomonas TaxID=196821 RepID=UPI00384FB36F
MTRMKSRAGRLFAYPGNTAVIAAKDVLFSGGWVAYVSHDQDDGGWQFHARYSCDSTEEVVVVSLESALSTDDTLLELFDLPLGWHAWRASRDGVWHRQEIPGASLPNT